MAPAMPKPQTEAVQTTHYSHQAYLILLCAFVLVPIIAGLDKFFHVLVGWNQISRQSSHV
jgi:hypothetical protein